MRLSLDLYASLIFFAAAIPYAWMGLYAWKKRPAVAASPFAWMMLCFSIWSAAYGAELALQSRMGKWMAELFAYFGIAPLPITLFFFALEFTGRGHLLSRRARAAFLATPALFWVLALGNHHHFLVWTSAQILNVNGLSFFVLQYGIAYWAFSFLWLAMIFGAIFLLAAEAMQRGRYRAQVNLMGMGILAPIISRILYLTRLDLVSYLDFSPLLAMPFSLGLAWMVTRRYRLQEIIPLEHLAVLNDMSDGAVILDERQRVAYLNPAAESLLGRPLAEALGQPVQYIGGQPGEEIAAQIAAGRPHSEIIFERDGQRKVFEMTVSKIDSSAMSRLSQESVYLTLLHDVTARKETESVLSRRESVMSALRATAELFLKRSLWEHSIPSALQLLGEAVNLSRIFIGMNYADREGSLRTSLCYEWTAKNVASHLNDPALQHVPMKTAGMERWVNILSQGRMITGLTKDFPQAEQDFLRRIGSLSVAAAPIFANKKWWGFIMFDECRRERTWTNIELEALSIAASLFGSAEERAQTELNLTRRQEALNILREIVLASLKAEDLLSMAHALVEKFAPLIHADRCALTLWDDGSKQEVRLAMHDPYEKRHPPLEATPADLTLTELALNHGKPLAVEDASEAFYAEKRATQTIPGRAALALPLIAGKKKLGAVILAFEQPRAFQAEEISICEQAADLVSLALEKFQTWEEAERRAANLETLRRAGAVVAETLKTEEAVARTLEQLKEVVPYDSASVQLLEDEALKIIGGSGFEDLSMVLGMTFPIPGDNPNTEVLRQRKPLIFNEISEIYEVFKRPPQNYIRSWLGVPLIFQERVIGLLAIDSKDPKRFTEKDVELAVMFADQVAAALENARLFKESQEQALTDPLTGIYNRRGLFQMGDFELARARRMNRPFSLLMFDIDHFKKINDEYGHPAGDEILRGLAERCRHGLRGEDVLCRYGGEEFVAFLPEANVETARHIAERLRLATIDAPFITSAGELQVSISVGVAQANENDSLKKLIERADLALYAAKRGGRNRVAVSGDSQSLSQT